MIDRKLLSLLGVNKKYIFITVALQILGMLANIGTMACICHVVWLLTQSAEGNRYLLPACIALFCIAVRYISSRLAGEVRDLLGRRAKKICASAYTTKSSASAFAPPAV